MQSSSYAYSMNPPSQSVGIERLSMKELTTGQQQEKKLRRGHGLRRLSSGTHPPIPVD